MQHPEGPRAGSERRRSGHSGDWLERDFAGSYRPPPRSGAGGSISAPESGDPRTVTLATVLDWYYETHGKKLAKPKNTEQCLNLWKAYFDDATTVSELTMQSVSEFTDWLGAKGHSIGYMSKTLRCGKAALNRAVEYGRLWSAPRIKDCQTQDDREGVEPMGRPLEIKEVARLFAACERPHIEAFMQIQLHTMCRPGAILDLTRSQVDFENGLIDFNPKGRRRNRKRRPILKLTSGLRETLLTIEREHERARAHHPELGAFKHYVTWKNKPVKAINRAFQVVVKNAGLRGTNVTLYSLRHTMGRELRRKRVSSEEIAMFLGHKPKNVAQATFFYAPFDPDYLIQSIEVVEDYASRLEVESRTLSA